MARVVESVVKDYEAVIKWNKVITKDLQGALRFGELSKKLGKPAPVPSIFINGDLVFEAIPSQEELKKYFDGILE
jgi:hypothetical protein